MKPDLVDADGFDCSTLWQIWVLALALHRIPSSRDIHFVTTFMNN